MKNLLKFLNLSRKLFLALLLSFGFLLLSSQSASAAPTVATLPTDMVFATQAQLFGNLINLDGASEVRVGFVYDTQYHASATNYAYFGDHSGVAQTDIMKSPAPFAATMPNNGSLSPETLYHYRAVTRNVSTRAITAQGEDMTFITDEAGEPAWKNPTGHIGSVDWENEERIYDGNVYSNAIGTVTGQTNYSAWLYLTSDPIDADAVRFVTGAEPMVIAWVEIEVYKSASGTWGSAYSGSWENDRWRGGNFDHGTVTQMRIRFVREGVYAGGTDSSGIGEVEFREYVPCTDTAPAPGGPTLSLPANGATGQSTSPTLDWNAISDWGINCAGNNNTYEVFLDTNASPTTSQGTVAEGTTSMAISGLSAGTTYYWKVRASNGILSSDSPIWSFTTEALPCLERSPSTLSFTATAGGSNPSDQTIDISNSGGGTLSWQSSDDQTWMATTDASLTSTVSINISGLSAGSYSGTVTLDANPPSQPGACQQKTVPVTLTVLACTPTDPTKPNLSSPANTAGGQPTSLSVSWQAVTDWGEDCVDNDGDDYYQVFLDENANPTTDQGTVARGTNSKTITGLNWGTTYYWKVRAYNGVEYSEFSNIWSFTTAPYLSVSPSSLSFSAEVGGSDPTYQEIAVDNDGYSWTKAEYPSDYGWMSLVQAGATVQVYIDITPASGDLAAGTYNATIRVAGTGPNQQNSPQDVAVTLVVTQLTGSISGEVWRDDTDGLCPVDGNLDTDREGAVSISSDLFFGSTRTNSSGYYEFADIPYDPGGTLYTVSVNRPSEDWSFACAGGVSGQGVKTVTLEAPPGISNWTVDFSIVGIRPGWFQVIDGDIHSEGNIENFVPN